MKNLTWQNPEQLFVAQVLINKVKSKCCGIKVIGKKYIPHGLMSLFRGNLLKNYKDEMYRSFREFYTDTHASNYPAEEMFFKIINSASMRVANEIINS